MKKPPAGSTCPVARAMSVVGCHQDWKLRNWSDMGSILLMKEILLWLRCMKPSKSWDIHIDTSTYHINRVLFFFCQQYGLYGCFKNSGTPKSSILIAFSIINHPFLGTPIFGNTHI